MGCLTLRPLNAVICVASVFAFALALSASAQGQTPPSPLVRPAPSEGVSWPPEGDTTTSGQGTTSTRQPAQQSSRQTQQQQRQTQTQTQSQAVPPTSRDTQTPGRSVQRSERPTSTRRDAPSTAPPTAAQEGLIHDAAADRGSGRDAVSAGAAGPTAHTVGGGSSGGGTAFTRGAAGAVSISGQGAFEPVMQREPDYGDVPEDGERLTLEGPMSLMEFLMAINLATNWNMLVSPVLQDTPLRFWISDTSPRDALEVLKFHKIFYEFDEETQFLRVMTREEYLEREFGKSRPHEFKVQHAEVSYVESMINSLLSSAGRVITDQRTNNIYVWDTDDNIQEMVRIIAEIDVPLQKAEFLIEHADLPDIEAVLASFMSPSGSILSDVRTGQIFVWDAPTVLEQMRTAVNRLDQPVASQTFHIVHINAEDVLDSVEVLLTERGTIQVDPRFNTLVVTDLPPRIARIADIIETLDQPLETRTWILNYAYPDFIADQIEQYIPGEMGQIIVQDEVHQITVTGLPSRLDEIDALIKEWDIKRKQVLIEAHIVEVGVDVERALNVNWSYFANLGGAPFALHSGSGAQPVSGPSAPGQIASGGRVPYAVPRYGALQLDDSGAIFRPVLTDISGATVIDRYRGGNVALALDYLDSQRKATILSSPRITVQDGEEAVFENATRVPYVSSTGGGYGYGYSPVGGSSTDPYRRSSTSSRVEFIDVGTILSVFPRITDEGNILLDISAEDSTFEDKDVIVDDLKRTVPQKTVRRADTQVRVSSGGTIVLGGLRRDRTSHATTRTPLLGDLPIVGRLFSSPSRKSVNNSLLIFITTTVVNEDTMPEAIEIAKTDQEVADAYRLAKKDLWGRLRHRASDGQNEIGVSIGQEGHLYCQGKLVSVEALRDLFFEAPKNMPVTAVIRKHPNAPVDIVNEVTEAAMEAGLRIEFDSDIPPIVPAIGVPG